MEKDKCYICGEIILEGKQGFYDRQCPDCYKTTNESINDSGEWEEYSHCFEGEWNGYFDNEVKILEGAYDR